MNFLASAIGSLTGSSIPYNIGEEQKLSSEFPQSIWKVFDGTKKVCTVGRLGPHYGPVVEYPMLTDQL